MTKTNGVTRFFLRKNREIVVCLFLIIATSAVYWPVRNHEFVFDDGQYVTDNQYVQRGLNRQSIIWAFTTTYAANYHPLTWLSHMLDCELFGVNPGRHHLINVLLHTANALLLFLFLRAITGALWRSGLVAALFALHPLHVESVAWVAERKDVLSTFFWMLTMWGYVWYVRHPGIGRYLVVLLLFVMGLMAKPMLVTMPFVLLLLDYWPLCRLEFGQTGCGHSPPPRASLAHLFLEKAPLLVLAAGSSVVTLVAQESGRALSSLQTIKLSERIANALVAYVSYIQKMFWPSNLAVLYPYSKTLAGWKVAGAGLLLVCIWVLAIKFVRRQPYVTMGWLWYVGTLLPVIGVVQVGSQAMADRYTYVPLVGLFIIVVWAFSELAANWRYRTAAFVTVATIVLLSLIVKTRSQLLHWVDNVTLFRHALAVTANNYLAHNNLGVVLSDKGHRLEAVAHYKAALAINPDYASAHNNLGFELFARGEFDRAIFHFSEALRLNPGSMDAHNNLGVVLMKMKKTDEAIYHFREALKIEPNAVGVKYNLIRALRSRGEPKGNE
jgi:tetratricopeptide (TPR) repeat protein